VTDHGATDVNRFNAAVHQLPLLVTPRHSDSCSERDQQRIFLLDPFDLSCWPFESVQIEPGSVQECKAVWLIVLDRSCNNISKSTSGEASEMGAECTYVLLYAHCKAH
jgi:hypothetical protein